MDLHDVTNHISFLAAEVNLTEMVVLSSFL